MNGRVVARRLQRRLPREILRVVGQRVQGVSPLDVERPESFASRYDAAVRLWSHSDDGGSTTLIPKHVEPEDVPGLAPFRNACEAVVLEVEDTSFSFRSHVLLDPQRRVVYSSSEPPAAVTRFRQYVSRRVRHVPGTVAYLSNLWVDNYYHWMQLTLPLLRFYRDVWPGSEIDYFYVGKSSLGRVQEETLARLGIDPSQIIREPCTADRIVTAVFDHRPQHSPGLRYRDAWGHRFTRDLFGDLRDSGYSRRIYVERGLVKNRRLKNEGKLLTFLAGRGFERVQMDGMSVAEQARVFANAEVIAGLHGAALTNLVFANPGTKVIEMFSSDHIEASYFAAATHSKLEYFYALGEPASTTNQDFSISSTKIASLFDAFSI